MNPALVIVVSGDRYWTDYNTIRDVLSEYRKDSVIFHGACKGVDSLADIAANELGMQARPYPAEWGRLGLNAGPVRNEMMCGAAKLLASDLGSTVQWIGFHPNIEASKGTKHCMKIAKKLDFAIRLIKS